MDGESEIESIRGKGRRKEGWMDGWILGLGKGRKGEGGEGRGQRGNLFPLLVCLFVGNNNNNSGIIN